MNILRCILMGVTFSFYTILRYDLDAVVWDACQQLFNPLSGKLNSNPGLKGTEWHNRLAERVEENVNFPQEPVTIKRPQTPPATTATSTTTSTALPSSTTGSASARVWFLNKLSKLLTKVRAFNASIHSCVCNIWTTVASLSTSVGLGCYKIMDSVELQHLVFVSYVYNVILLTALVLMLRQFQIILNTFERQTKVNLNVIAVVIPY